MTPWKDVDLERERRSFIDVRKKHVSMWGVSLVFAFTLFLTWFCSWVLLKMDLQSMPWRYALSILAGYGAFFCAIRIWADYQKKYPSERQINSDSSALDFPAVDAEGCLIFVLFIGAAFLIAVLFAWVGTGLLLEVAFEVAFAGALVRRMGEIQEVGNWHIVLFKKTCWLVALLMVVVCASAYYCQSKYPKAATITQVWKQWTAEK